MRIELLWFHGCPNHEGAERMLRDVMRELDIDAPIDRIDVEDGETGKRVCFPGSPTIRIDGHDVEPGWQPCEDCSPRCRLYSTEEGLRGLPERDWVVAAFHGSDSG